MRLVPAVQLLLYLYCYFICLKFRVLLDLACFLVIIVAIYISVLKLQCNRRQKRHWNTPQNSLEFFEFSMSFRLSFWECFLWVFCCSGFRQAYSCPFSIASCCAFLRAFSCSICVCFYCPCLPCFVLRFFEVYVDFIVQLFVMLFVMLLVELSVTHFIARFVKYFIFIDFLVPPFIMRFVMRFGALVLLKIQYTFHGIFYWLLSFCWLLHFL